MNVPGPSVSRPTFPAFPTWHLWVWSRWGFPAVAALIAYLGVALSITRAADPGGRRVVLVTSDGLRWQEVFQGAEEALMTKEPGGVKNTNTLRADFLRPTAEERRRALMPFLWGRVATEGQLWGNHALQSVVRVTNTRNFSYPGYSEFLTGAPEASIDSNDARPNPHVNVFQWLASRPSVAGRVGAALSWGVLPWVLNSQTGEVPVWSAFEVPAGTRRIALSPAAQELLDRMTPIWADVSQDAFTWIAARDHLRTREPRAMYVAFGETDDWAHEGRYDLYLRAARNFDRFVSELWDQLQSTPGYQGNTTLVLTTDHGRGTGPVAWKSHGAALSDSAYIWVGVLGPDTPALGERSGTPPATQGQIAATVAAALGEDFPAAHPRAAAPLPVFRKR